MCVCACVPASELQERLGLACVLAPRCGMEKAVMAFVVRKLSCAGV